MQGPVSRQRFTSECTFLTQLTIAPSKRRKSIDAMVRVTFSLRRTNSGRFRHEGMQEPLRVEHGSKTYVCHKVQLETLARRMHRTGILYYEALEEFKKQFILVVLRDVNWNKSKAARVLGMHRSTLVRSLRELHIDNRTLRNAERRPPHGTRTPQQNRDVG